MALFMVLTSGNLPAFADLCPVPSLSHVTIQAAVDDPACTEIEVAAGTFIESVVIPRDLVLRGASTTATESSATTIGPTTTSRSPTCPTGIDIEGVSACLTWAP
jgi:hypothetical protein